MTPLFGTNGPTLPQTAVAFAVILFTIGLVLLAVRSLRRRKEDSLAREVRPGRPPRLGIVGIHELDERRQLILLRRDGVEHLLLVGGPNDLVVESGIRREVEAFATHPDAVADEAVPAAASAESPVPAPASARPAPPSFPEAMPIQPPPSIPSSPPPLRAEPFLDGPGPAPAKGSLATTLGAPALPPASRDDAPDGQAPEVRPDPSPRPARSRPFLEALRPGKPAERPVAPPSGSAPTEAPAPVAAEPAMDPKPAEPVAAGPAEAERPAKAIDLAKDAPAPPQGRAKPIAGANPVDMARLLEDALAAATEPAPEAEPKAGPSRPDARSEATPEPKAAPAPAATPEERPRPQPAQPERPKAASDPVSAGMSTRPPRPALRPAPEPAPRPLSDTNPFSVDEIEAEFARLLGRPLDKVG